MGDWRTGVVSENMQGLGAKLRKLASQAKICTPPGGEVIAKICVLRYIPFFPLSPPSGGGYVSHRESRRRRYQIRVPPPLPPPLPVPPPLPRVALLSSIYSLRAACPDS